MSSKTITVIPLTIQPQQQYHQFHKLEHPVNKIDPLQSRRLIQPFLNIVHPRYRKYTLSLNQQRMRVEGGK